MRQPGCGRRRRGDRRDRASPRGARNHPRRRGPAPRVAARRRASSSKAQTPIVVVDAIRTPAGARPPGTVVRADAGPDGLPAEIGSSLSSHGFGVVEAFGLASAIGPTPRGRGGRRGGGADGPGAADVGSRSSGAAASRRDGRPGSADALPRRPNGPKPPGRATHHAAARRRQDEGADDGRGLEMSARGMSGPVTELLSAREIEVRGIVQGVGFRPFVWRLASDAGLTGRVRNRSGVVEIVVEGADSALDDFCSALETQAPALARVDSVTWRDAAPTGFEAFDVDESVVGLGGERLVSAGRRNVRAVSARAVRPGRPPVQVPVHQLHRLRTTLHHHRGAPLRPRAHEHARLPDVRRLRPRVPRSGRPQVPRGADRVPGCGPHLELLDRESATAGRRPHRTGGSAPRPRRDRRAEGARRLPPRLRRHDESAVAILRERKWRPDKPFAVMIADLDDAADRFVLNAHEETELSSSRAPIVLGPGSRHARALRGAGPSSAGCDAAIDAAPPPSAA